MARFDTSGLDQLIRDMQKMGQSSGPLAEAMVEAAVIEIRNSWQETADEYGFRDTGDMIESIGFATAPKKVGDIVYNDVYPQGKDRKGTRNALKAFILHYGGYGGIGGSNRLPATNWVDVADKKAEPKVQAALEKIMDQYIESGGTVPAVVDTGRSARKRHK